MPYKNQTMFRYKNRNPSYTATNNSTGFSKQQSVANYYRKERCPENCNNTYQVNDVVGNVRTCPKVIGGSSRCIPLNANTMINANVPTQPNGFPAKKYYTSNKEYMYARCKTFDQNQFNFYRSSGVLESNCCGNEAGYSSSACNRVVYKPNNTPFSTQGAVSSSTRLMRLKYNEIVRPPTGVKYPPNYNSNSNMVKDSFCKPNYRNPKKNVC